MNPRKKEMLEKWRKVKLPSTTTQSCSLIKSDIDVEDNSSSNTSPINQSDNETYSPFQKKIRVSETLKEKNKTTFTPEYEKNLFTKPVTRALDRTKISDCKAARLIIPIIAALEHDLASMPVSRSLVKRRKKQKETQHLAAEELTKVLENKETIILVSKKVGRLPILNFIYHGRKETTGNVKTCIWHWRKCWQCSSWYYETLGFWWQNYFDGFWYNIS